MTIRNGIELHEVDHFGDGDGRHPPEGWERLTAAGLAVVECGRAGSGASGSSSRAVYIPELELELDTLETMLAARPWPIARHCSTRFRARRSSGRRRLSAISLGVVHCTQSLTAIGAASWFANPASRGSAHVVVDALECYRTLPPSAIPWGAPGANGRGWHLELAGFAQWTRAEWLARRGTLERGAFKLALHARAFDFPIVRLTDVQLRRGAAGVVDHRQCSRVFGGSHWDVGSGFPWDVFLARARAYRKELDR